MLRILENIYAGSETNGKVESVSGYGSEKIIPDPQHCFRPRTLRTKSPRTPLYAFKEFLSSTSTRL
jgi:hypothetical protein